MESSEKIDISLEKAKEILQWDGSLLDGKTAIALTPVKRERISVSYPEDDPVYEKIMSLAGDNKYQRAFIVKSILFSALLLGGGGGGGVAILSRSQMKKEKKIHKMKAETKAGFMDIYRDDTFKKKLAERRAIVDAEQRLDEYDKERFPMGPPPPPPSS